MPGPAEVPAVYAPALVAFVGTPSLGLGIGVGGGAAVAWFPLGPREVYVPSYQVSREYVNRVNVSNTRVNSVTVTNVYNATIVNDDRQVTKITYLNRTAPGAITMVPGNAFRSGEHVDRSAVRVNERELEGATVIRRAQVAPTRNSLLGASESEGIRHAPPRGIVDRPVVAKTTPPAPPVSFDRQAAALAAHPGEPLRHSEAEALRPANAESPHPMIRQIPGRQTEAGIGRREGQEDRPSGAIANRPANVAPAEAPQNGARNDRTVSVQPENRGRSGEQPEVQPRYQPAKEQPGFVQPSHAVEKETTQPNTRPPARVFEMQGNPEPPPAPRKPNSNRQPANAPANRGSNAPSSQAQRQVTSNPPPTPARESAPAPRPNPAPQVRSESQARPASAPQLAAPANKGESSEAHGKAEKKKN